MADMERRDIRIRGRFRNYNKTAGERGPGRRRHYSVPAGEGSADIAGALMRGKKVGNRIAGNAEGKSAQQQRATHLAEK